MTTSINLTTSTPTQIIQDAATQLNAVVATLQRNASAVASMSTADQTAVENALTAIGVDLNAVSTALATSGTTPAATAAGTQTVTAGQAAALAIGTLVVGGLVVWGISSLAKGKHHEGVHAGAARENPIRRRRRSR